jgi:predicted thioredoxin/glutaredoxin
MDRGVMMTPALAVDGELKISGRVADVREIEALLKG